MIECVQFLTIQIGHPPEKMAQNTEHNYWGISGFFGVWQELLKNKWHFRNEKLESRREVQREVVIVAELILQELHW